MWVPCWFVEPVPVQPVSLRRHTFVLPELILISKLNVVFVALWESDTRMIASLSRANEGDHAALSPCCIGESETGSNRLSSLLDNRALLEVMSGFTSTRKKRHRGGAGESRHNSQLTEQRSQLSAGIFRHSGKSLRSSLPGNRGGVHYRPAFLTDIQHPTRLVNLASRRAPDLLPLYSETNDHKVTSVNSRWSTAPPVRK